MNVRVHHLVYFLVSFIHGQLLQLTVAYRGGFVSFERNHAAHPSTFKIYSVTAIYDAMQESHRYKSQECMKPFSVSADPLSLEIPWSP